MCSHWAISPAPTTPMRMRSRRHAFRLPGLDREAGLARHAEEVFVAHARVGERMALRGSCSASTTSQPS